MGIEQAEGDDQATADRGQGHQQRGADEGQAHGGDHQRQGQIDEGERQEQQAERCAQEHHRAIDQQLATAPFAAQFPPAVLAQPDRQRQHRDGAEHGALDPEQPAALEGVQPLPGEDAGAKACAHQRRQQGAEEDELEEGARAFIHSPCRTADPQQCRGHANFQQVGRDEAGRQGQGVAECQVGQQIGQHRAPQQRDPAAQRLVPEQGDGEGIGVPERGDAAGLAR
ncbi:hypothetical protein D9M68_515730 [compost metagenome]